ncbi:hypothetical protein BAUCODRAFT_80221 [Baudoinia panamericana UAMH 10762]|uniref:Fungal lipase-type domain-containing protein n=1 Tax=Baudoinia panamericana (strain UAMH 10762) TaxID=717646 RepID=M2LBM0_BAUPA|nr:uncharacterized protein BAUCODRAFT_80221 [Baudoinia panamericana UAMH 10762]EMC91262.1 hypothetical protein BAUCODRAFT_80221 [Baudoinia panamericana UAMH 10762]
MRLQRCLVILLHCLGIAAAVNQIPLEPKPTESRNVSVGLFYELEELARIVDISYCVGLTSFGIVKPFKCLSRCSDFPEFALVTTWNTGPLLKDSCGYIALDHGKQRVIVAFRGTYSIANAVVDLSTVPQEYVPYPGPGDDDSEGDDERVTHAPRCNNCTVHMGFQSSWQTTRSLILAELKRALFLHPLYKLHLVGHSLGGAVAALAGLDLVAYGYRPIVTTFGEPRLGNAALAGYLDDRFGLSRTNATLDEEGLTYRRVTHVNDPVPLLPLTEWGYSMHAGEIFISKSSLSPDLQDVQLCVGDEDPSCIADQDSTLPGHDSPADEKRDLLASVEHELYDIKQEPWGIPTRYKLWQLLFAHRDYFWRIGLCTPGGDPTGGGGKYYLDGD